MNEKARSNPMRALSQGGRWLRIETEDKLVRILIAKVTERRPPNSPQAAEVRRCNRVFRFRLVKLRTSVRFGIEEQLRFENFQNVLGEMERG